MVAHPLGTLAPKGGTALALPQPTPCAEKQLIPAKKVVLLVGIKPLCRTDYIITTKRPFDGRTELTVGILLL